MKCDIEFEVNGLTPVVYVLWEDSFFGVPFILGIYTKRKTAEDSAKKLGIGNYYIEVSAIFTE